MSRIYDNWERLVNATLLREKLRQLSREDSISTTCSSEFTWSSFRESNSPYLGISFSYKQVAEATNRFSDENFIKRGHSGDLFKAFFPRNLFLKNILFSQVSSILVVKRIRFDQVSNYREYLSSELKLFSRINNSRSGFVPLVGHCFEVEEEKFLIYEYLERRHLGYSLFNKIDYGAADSLASLDWIRRLKIAIGVARVLAYLHHECDPPLVHGDVQASSIFLDHGLEVRLGSLNKVSAQDNDSGNPKVTCAYDVYCLGKVLLELITGCLSISSATDATLKECLETTIPYIDIYDMELIKRIVDLSLIIEEDLLEEVWAIAVVAKSCLNPNPSRRPLMHYILKALEDPLCVVRGDHKTINARRHNPSDVAAVLVDPSQGTAQTTDWNVHSSWLLK